MNDKTETETRDADLGGIHEKTPIRALVFFLEYAAQVAEKGQIARHDAEVALANAYELSVEAAWREDDLLSFVVWVAANDKGEAGDRAVGLLDRLGLSPEEAR